jgi:hypothetical protein
MPFVRERFGMNESPSRTMGAYSQYLRPTVPVHPNKFKVFFARKSVFVRERAFCTSSSPVCHRPLTHFIHQFPLVRYRMEYKTRTVNCFQVFVEVVGCYTVSHIGFFQTVGVTYCFHLQGDCGSSFT